MRLSWLALVWCALVSTSTGAQAATCDAPLTVRAAAIEHLVPALTERAQALRLQVMDAVGPPACAPVAIDVLPRIESAVSLQPAWHLPTWAAGAANPRAGRVVVALTAQRNPQDEERILLHELAHLGIHQVGGADVPRWLDEGIARVLAGEHGPDDLSALARARVSDQLVPLAAIAERFPADPQRARLAYAQAGRAVSLLRARGPDVVPTLLGQLKQGALIDDALFAVSGRRLWQLDVDVARSIPLASAWAIVGRETDLALGFAAVVAALAGVRARRRLHARLLTMDLGAPLDEPGVVRWTVPRAA